jgi:pyruvate, orthophosphate dikinase
VTIKIFQQFSKGKGDKDADPAIWGGKGAGLARMAAQGYPVPPGFTITTELCRVYQEQPEAVIDAIMTDIGEQLEWLDAQFDYPPLMSVRSGAPVSMPGMMDTILNVGLTSVRFPEWVKRIGERAAWDSRRRLLQMMGTTCFGLDGALFEKMLHEAREKQGVATDAELNVNSLKKVFDAFRGIYAEAGVKVPDTVEDQLRVCIDTVFKSWMGPNAIEYRKIESIDDSIGTAVTVQAMVFGNMNDKSGSGVLFTRDPSTGEKKIFAEYLANAQGEDVVAGIRTPDQLGIVHEANSSKAGMWKAELFSLCSKLEKDYQDMVDAEFTVQDSKLFILQSRVGKRSARAAFKIAVDLFKEGVITEDEMFTRVKRKQLLAVRRPSIDPKFKNKPCLTGMRASQGIAIGEVVFSSKEAVIAAAAGHKVILVTHETTPDDIAGMAVSVGILTKTGGATSHAAVVARGMDKPCVVGCTELDLWVNGTFKANDVISIDGATGRVWKGEVPVVGGELDDGPKEFVDMLLAKQALFPQVAIPAPNSTVVLADWLSLTDKEITERVKQLVDASQGGMVLIDITPPDKFGSTDDELAWNICGQVPELATFAERIVHKVLHAKVQLENCRVAGGNDDMRELFALKEFDVLPQVTTVSELLKQTGLVGIDHKLAQSIAPDGDMRATLAQLKAAGVFKGQIVTGSTPAAYAALDLMKE